MQNVMRGYLGTDYMILHVVFFCYFDFYVLNIVFFMQDSYIGCHNLLQTSQILLRDDIAVSRPMYTPALRHLIKEYTGTLFIDKCTHGWRSINYMWFADNNQLIWRLSIKYGAVCLNSLLFYDVSFNSVNMFACL